MFCNDKKLNIDYYKFLQNDTKITRNMLQTQNFPLLVQKWKTIGYYSANTCCHQTKFLYNTFRSFNHASLTKSA